MVNVINFREKSFVPSFVLLLGAPGIGKGTQSDLAIKDLKFLGANVLYVASGDLCRAIARDPKHVLHVDFKEDSDVQKNKGITLASDEMLYKILKHEFRQLNLSQYHYVFLDGVVRTSDQVIEVFDILSEVNDEYKYNLILDYSATKETCMSRAASRLAKAKAKGEKSRADDEPEEAEKRFEDYEKFSKELGKLLKILGKEAYHKIQAEGEIDDIHRETMINFIPSLKGFISAKK